MRIGLTFDLRAEYLALGWSAEDAAEFDTEATLQSIEAGLRELGHELRRPEADLLRDGIYELRASLQGVHYRILYFFHGAVAAVLAHGIVKEGAVPPKEIDRAIERKKRFEANPAKHRQEESTK